MSEKRALAPRLRFPEFRNAGEWRVCNLGDISTVVRGGSPRPIDGFITTENSGLNWLKIGDVDKEAKYVTKTQEKVRPEALIKTREVHPGDLILSNSMSFGRPYLMRIKSCIHDGWIAVTEICDSVKREYLYYLIFSSASQVYFLDNAAGSGVLNLNADIIKNLPTSYPTCDEQQKIADCLSSLDTLIAAQAEKIDVLKTHKKGLMQQLLPREGETIPRLRFPEFWDAGGWKLLALGEKIDLLSGFPFRSAEISGDPSGTPLMRGVNITEGFIRHSADIDKFFLGDTSSYEKYRLQVNDLVIGMDGSKVGKNSALVTESDSGSLLIQRVARLRAKCQATVQFIFHHIYSSKFHSYVDRVNTSSGIPHISAKQINEFEICFPPVDEEQQKIANFLSSLDVLIAAQTEKLDTLKAHKKGLMQQLFPGVEAVIV